jgi:hypothetical protein
MRWRRTIRSERTGSIGQEPGGRPRGLVQRRADGVVDQPVRAPLARCPRPAGIPPGPSSTGRAFRPSRGVTRRARALAHTLTSRCDDPGRGGQRVTIRCTHGQCESSASSSVQSRHSKQPRPSDLGCWCAPRGIRTPNRQIRSQRRPVPARPPSPFASRLPSPAAMPPGRVGHPSPSVPRRVVAIWSQVRALLPDLASGYD